MAGDFEKLIDLYRRIQKTIRRQITKLVRDDDEDDDDDNDDAI